MAGKEEKEDTGDIINSKKVTEATDISGKKKKKTFRHGVVFENGV